VTGAGQGPGGTPEGTAFEVVSLDARPELTLPAIELLAVGWPEFMQHDPVAERHQARLATELAGFQVLLLDDKDELAALGVAIPFAWDGTLAGLPGGWDAVVTTGVADLDAGRRPTALSALSVTVAPARRGQGLSRLVIQALKDAAARAGLATLLAPVRPSGKSAYPLTPMERYVRALGPARRHPVRPLAAHPLAARRRGPRGLPGLHGDHRRGRRLGSLDRADLPRDRPVRGPGRARAAGHRPGA